MKSYRIIILLILVFSCSDQQDYLSTLAGRGLNHHLLLGIVLDDGNNSEYITVISNTDLFYSIYNSKFNNSIDTYSMFLKKVFEGELFLFPLIKERGNELILYDSKLINTTDFNRIKNKYFIRKKGYLVFKDHIELNLKYHLIKYMTSNEYFIIFDDYAAEYRFINRI
mgnify:FL=1